ncbi:unnamed protein product [Brachionus calyciflorus]|uniref:Uncharacterized protein n=1 Tax=Brachionus calyciflorus TaxID=104777 RepID=A0A813UW73_9BILA|nr:unnamed protein product [Brachionus calyciflorus]
MYLNNLTVICFKGVIDSIDVYTFQNILNIKEVSFQTESTNIIQNSQSKWLKYLIESNINVKLEFIFVKNIDFYKQDFCLYHKIPSYDKFYLSFLSSSVNCTCRQLMLLNNSRNIMKNKMCLNYFSKKCNFNELFKTNPKLDCALCGNAASQILRVLMFIHMFKKAYTTLKTIQESQAKIETRRINPTLEKVIVELTTNESKFNTISEDSLIKAIKLVDYFNKIKICLSEYDNIDFKQDFLSILKSIGDKEHPTESAYSKRTLELSSKANHDSIVDQELENDFEIPQLDFNFATQATFSTPSNNRDRIDLSNTSV